jgi:hypothetical protein
VALTDFGFDPSDPQILEAAADIERVLDLDGRVLDLSPGFRRLMFALEQSMIDELVRGTEIQRRGGGITDGWRDRSVH